MHRLLAGMLVAAVLLGSGLECRAADAGAQLQELVDKVKAKLQAGKRTEEELAPELKAFDALLEEHKGEKTEEVARILLMKARLYSEVLKNEAKGAELQKQLETEFPGTATAKRADPEKIQSRLVVGSPFPDFDEKDLSGQPLSVSKFKGKVVLIDFWATWCGPCVAELPAVLKAYEKYHDKGFEIIGISLDKDKEKLTSFIEEKKLTWPQFFDGKGWENKLAGEYGVNSIPATYLLNKEGIIVAKGLRGDALETEIAKALE